MKHEQNRGINRQFCFVLCFCFAAAWLLWTTAEHKQYRSLTRYSLSTTKMLELDNNKKIIIDVCLMHFCMFNSLLFHYEWFFFFRFVCLP